MNSLWAKFTLDNFQPSHWREGSFLYKLVGLLSPLRQGSWLVPWIESLGAIFICLTIILAPFVSTSTIGILLIGAALFWLLLTLTDDAPPAVTPIHLLLLLYWFIATFAVAFSPVKMAAIEGWIKLTLNLLMFALAARVLRSPLILSLVTGTFLHIALIVSIYGVRQQFAGVEQLATWNDPTSPLANDSRVYSYLGNPNLLAAYLLPAIALSLAAIFVWRSPYAKALAITMTLVNLACLYYTDSRGGWIGALALIAVFLVLLRYWWGSYLPLWARTWLLPLVGGAILTALIVAIIALEPLRLRFFSIFAGRGDSSNNFRINVWAAVIDMIKDRPFLGIGPGNDAFNKVYPRFMRPNYTALSAYSIFLELTVETGFIGLSCFLWTIIVAFSHGVRQLGRWRTYRQSQGLWIIGAIAGMIGLIAHGFVDTVWYRPQISTLWWLMMAIIASQTPPRLSKERGLGGEV